MLTLSYGYKQPQSGDTGSTLWQALEDDISRLNGHTHNGTDSAHLPVQNFTTTKQLILAAAWAGFGGPTGHYRQAVAIPAGFTFDDFSVDFRDTATGRKLYMGVTKIDNTSFYLYSIDNTLAVTAVYGV